MKRGHHYLPMLLAASLVAAPSPDAAVRAGSPPGTSRAANESEHWSFRPLVRPPVPSVQHRDWIRNEIDCFVMSKLEQQQLLPQPPADRATLLRRLSFDLTGLPPTPEELQSFLNDDSPAAYERLVDRLLASPHYGERWAQHWLDLARFAETDGFEHDKVRPEAWRYRDWVIDAWNEDLPWDRFVAWQLAGDELAPGDPASRVATGFCLAGPDMPDMNAQPERRHNVLNELTATVGAVFLGLQFGCAQCHDHVYDPISQADFYGLRAVFEPAVTVKKDVSLSWLLESGATTEPSFLYVRGDWQRPGQQVKPAFPSVANPSGERFVPVSDATSGRRAALAQWLTRPDHPLTSRVLVNRLWQHHFGQGLCRTPSDVGLMGDEPLQEELLDWLATEFIARNGSVKELQRLVVTSATYRQAAGGPWRDLPAAQRQAVQRHLDAAIERDPDNRLWARFTSRRLEGEAIRDAMLRAVDGLSTRRGGPGVRPPLPAPLVETLLKGQWEVSPDPEDHCRRSIYVFARRNLRYPLFEVFDRPDANASGPLRGRSTTALQALEMLNASFSLEMARRLAGCVLAETNHDDARLQTALLRTLGRPPDAGECARFRQFLSSQGERWRSAGGPPGERMPLPCPDGIDPCQAAAWTDLCLALFNTSEFVYVD